MTCQPCVRTPTVILAITNAREKQDCLLEAVAVEDLELLPRHHRPHLMMIQIMKSAGEGQLRLMICTN